MAYISLAQVKQYLGIDVSDDDDLLSSLITRAQGFIEAPRPTGTGRKFESETDTRYFYREDIDGKVLYMETHDLLSVSTLTNGNGEVIPANGYRLEPRNGSPFWQVRLLGDYYWQFDDRDSEVVVEGSWGYSATPPEPIVQATLRMAAWLYRQKDSGSDGDRVIMSDGVTVLPGRLPQDVEELIKPYRRKL